MTVREWFRHWRAQEFRRWVTDPEAARHGRERIDHPAMRAFDQLERDAREFDDYWSEWRPAPPTTIDVTLDASSPAVAVFMDEFRRQLREVLLLNE